MKNFPKIKELFTIIVIKFKRKSFNFLRILIEIGSKGDVLLVDTIIMFQISLTFLNSVSGSIFAVSEVKSTIFFFKEGQAQKPRLRSIDPLPMPYIE